MNLKLKSKLFFDLIPMYISLRDHFYNFYKENKNKEYIFS